MLDLHHNANATGQKDRLNPENHSESSKSGHRGLHFDAKAQPDHSSLPQIKGNFEIVTSDGYTVCDMKLQAVTHIDEMSKSFEDLRKTWANKREKVSRLA
jgi:hypothetical protein